MIELRFLGPDDWPVWRDLRLAALAEAPYAFGSTLAQWQGDGDREERWRNRLAIPGSHNVVAAGPDGPVGMAGGVPGEQPDAAELISMWVSPAARGRGVGDLLIAEITRWAAQRGATVLRLSVMPDNRAAAALYERHGFADTGERGDLLPDGVRREVVMAKAL
ncbi:GNAT family N-acetyltransferase [Actinacidiphila sp. DG2A-62]|uniref:GNAT family N-acetyltransferase n=1 Tax=Actinacidiphila sp. DG2A-62 TaxID=3108821 RepID=UPI002DBC67D5|nr:GNAT family N-acetyltransferase [Actinacidiphila sp. DG2A-62]MEC3992139.1 GNAT family N-acetyltransferase [Actinacidiphila sp. DG2A-62]